MERRDFNKGILFLLAWLGFPINLHAEKGKLAIVLDDALNGSNNEIPNLEKLAEKEIPITIAVLPNRDIEEKHRDEVFKILSQYENADILLHQPMEPKDMTKRGLRMDPRYGIFDKDIAQIVLLKIDKNKNYLNRLLKNKQVRGLNYHMGSLAAGNNRLMRSAVSYCLWNNLIILDSFTHSSSKLYKVAEEIQRKGYHIKAFKKNYPFLDHGNKTKQWILNELIESYRSSIDQNQIKIGHLYKKNTVDAILEFYKDHKNIYRISELSQVVKPSSFLI